MYETLYSPVSSSKRCVGAAWASPFLSATSPPIEPTCAEEREYLGCRFFKKFASRSSELSWLPIMTIVFSISPGSRMSSTSTSVPAAMPSLMAGTLSIPSALTSESMRPAPLPSGVAMRFSPTRPSFILKNSSCPSEEATCLESLAFIFGVSTASRP